MKMSQNVLYVLLTYLLEHGIDDELETQLHKFSVSFIQKY